jgi:hypothetical protein
MVIVRLKTLAAEHRLAEHLAEDGRGQPGEVDERLAADRLRAALERRRPVDHASVALERIRLGDGQLDEQRGEYVALGPHVLASADVDRDLAAEPGLRRLFAAGQQQPAQGARRDREHDVVDGPAEPVLDRLQVVEPEVHGGEAARGAQPAVEAGLRRADQLLVDRQVGDRNGARERVAGVQEQAGTGARALEQQVGVEPRVDGVVGARDGDRPVRGRAAPRRARLGVQQDAADVDRPHAVDQAMVRLGGQRPAAAGEAVEQDHLPQRPAAVDPVREEVGEPLLQLGIAAGRRERRVADVVGDGEVRHRLPVRPGQVSRARAREAHAVARQLEQAPVEMAAHLLDVGGAAAAQRVEHHRRAEVHRRAVVGLLEVEEHRVQGAELLDHVVDLVVRRAAAHPREHGSRVRTWPHGSPRGFSRCGQGRTGPE